MSSLITSKPIRGTQLNKAHPLAQGLVGCWVFNEDAGDTIVDLAGEIGNGLKGSTVSWDKNGIKSSSAYDDANSVVNLPTPDLTTWGGVSVVSELTFNGLYGEYPGVVACVPTGEYYGGFLLSIEQDTDIWFRAGNSATNVGVAAALGEKIKVAGTWDKSYLTSFKNGVKQQSVAQSADFITGNLMHLLGYYRTTWRTPRNVPVKYIYIYDHSLTPVEVASLHTDPYQIFEPSFDIGAIDFNSGGSQTIYASTAWNILVATALQTSWNIKAQSSASLAWNIKDEASKNTAWNILNQDVLSTAWNIENSIETATAWNIKNIIELFTAWNIGSGATSTLTLTTAWNILNEFGFNTGWNIRNKSESNTAWNILNRNNLSSAWNIKTSISNPTSWNIKNQVDLLTAWNILNSIDQNISWNILTRKEQQTVWNILSQKTILTSWNIGTVIAIIKTALRRIYKFDTERRIYKFDTERRIYK